MTARNEGPGLRNLPLGAFAAVYLVTFFFGAATFLSGPEPLVRLFAQHAGVRPFRLEPGDVLSNWLLILAAPALFAAGWTLRVRRDALAPAAAKAALPLKALTMLYGALLAVAGISLARAGAFSRLGSWLDYGFFIQARLAVFSRLTFAEWVNLYALIPTAAGLLVVRLAAVPSRGRRYGAIAAVVLSLLAVDVLVFQKRYAVLSLLFLAACAAVARPDALSSRRRTLLLAAGAGLAAYLAFCGLVVLSTSSRTPAVVQGPTTGLLDAGRSAAPEPVAPAPAPALAPAPAPAPTSASRPTTRPRDYYTEIRKPWVRDVVAKVFPARWVGRFEPRPESGGETIPVRFAYALLAPVTRLPQPALAYPALFPRILGYFGLDVGADLLGFGRMPDDNLVVYAALYGALDGGAVSVPFQYAWFSQIGLWGALALCFPLGAAAAAAWDAARTRPRFHESRAALGALVVLFVLYVTQDSVRGALLNSYGVAWGAGLVLAVDALLARGGAAATDRS